MPSRGRQLHVCTLGSHARQKAHAMSKGSTSTYEKPSDHERVTMNWKPMKVFGSANPRMSHTARRTATM